MFGPMHLLDFLWDLSTVDGSGGKYSVELVKITLNHGLETPERYNNNKQNNNIEMIIVTTHSTALL